MYYHTHWGCHNVTGRTRLVRSHYCCHPNEAIGMRVEVYVNLHTDTLSLRALEGPDKGKVIAHPTFVELSDAKFAVQSAGNARVRRERKKNVHAFVRGNLEHLHAGTVVDRRQLGHGQFMYNPYKHTTFVDRYTGKPIFSADRVLLSRHEGNSVGWYR